MLVIMCAVDTAVVRSRRTPAQRNRCCLRRIRFVPAAPPAPKPSCARDRVIPRFRPARRFPLYYRNPRPFRMEWPRVRLSKNGEMQVCDRVAGDGPGQLLLPFGQFTFRVKGAKSPLRVQSSSFSNFISLKNWTGSGAKRLF